MMSKNKKPLSGFTLIEMMIVVAIIAIVAVIAIEAYTQQLLKGNDSKRKADLDRIKIAVEEYEKDHSCYPSLSSMSKCGSDPTIAIHPYLTSVPCDPVSGTAYTYENDGASCPAWFRLYTVLQNTNDTGIISRIGPGYVYNFYVSSSNAPNPVSSSFGVYHYGCINSTCQPIPLDQNGNPICSGKTFDTSNCNGNDCTNPANACN